MRALPTDYWTHPMNRKWWMIAGDWLMDRYNAPLTSFNPYGTGPETAHGLWKFQTAVGGIIGEDWGTMSYRERVSGTSLAIGESTFIIFWTEILMQ